MAGLPPIPAWNGLHPLVVHFPVALLLVAPLLVVAALLVRRLRPGLLVAALLLMALGVVGAFVAVSTGEAAGRLAERTPEVSAVIERHEELAERTRLVFSVLLAALAALVLAPGAARRDVSPRPYVAALLVFLAAYGGAALILVNTAHDGGRLVHELGVRAVLAAPAQPTVAEETGNH